MSQSASLREKKKKSNRLFLSPVHIPIQYSKVTRHEIQFMSLYSSTAKLPGTRFTEQRAPINLLIVSNKVLKESGEE